jgi:hypothetical protein
MPTTLTQKFGDVILGNNGKPLRFVAAPRIGYGSMIRDVIAKVDGSPDVSAVTVAGFSKGYDGRWLPEGMNVIIAGAAANGKDLVARVLKSDGTTLTLNAKIQTRVKNANLTYLPLTLSQ